MKKFKFPTWGLYTIDIVLLLVLVLMLGAWKGGWFDKQADESGAFVTAKNKLALDDTPEEVNTNGELLQTGPLWVKVESDNGVIIHIEHEYLKQLDMKQITSDSWEQIGGVELYFFDDRDNAIVSVYLNTATCDIVLQENDSFKNIQIDKEELTDGVIDLNVQMLGIGRAITNSSGYRLEGLDIDNKMWIELASGETKKVLSTGENSSQNSNTEGITARVIDSDTVSFSINDRKLLDEINKGGARIYLYSDSNYSDIACCEISLSRLSDIRYEVHSYLNDRIEVNSDGSRGIYPTAIEYDMDNQSLYDLTINEKGAYFKLKYPGISEKVQSNPFYFAKTEYYDNWDTDICVGELNFNDSANTLAAQSIPDIFVTNNEDAVYFYPDTDKYRIIRFDFDDTPLPQTKWWYDHYGICYWGVNRTSDVGGEDDVKVYYLLSYDDVNVISVKCKVVYETEEHAREATYASNEAICPKEFGGPNEPNDAFIESVIDEWYAGCEEEFLEHVPYSDYIYADSTGWSTSERGISYNGMFGNVRYFNYSPNADESGMIKALPITSHAMGFSMFNSEIEDIESIVTFEMDNEVSEQIRYNQNDYSVVTYSSF